MLRGHGRAGAMPSAARGSIIVLAGLLGVVAPVGSSRPTTTPIVTGSSPPAVSVAVAVVTEPREALSPATPAPTPTATPPPTPPQPVARPAAPPGLDPETLANDSAALLNADRQAQGLAPLQVSTALSHAAAVHAAQNAAQGRLFHDGLVAVVDAQHVGWHIAGECLAWERGTTDAAYINAMWLKSPEHRAVILTPQYTTIGVGWVQAGDGAWYVSAIFIA